MKEPAIPKTQETIVWWGGYSPWTMTPSLLICVVLSGAIAWWASTYLDRGDVRIAILSLTGLVWVVQTLRFGNRFFGVNYFLTTRRAIHEWGILFKRSRTVFLADVAEVKAERTGLEEPLGVGRVVLKPRANGEPAMVWRGVRQCNQVVELVKGLVAKASDARPSAPDAK